MNYLTIDVGGTNIKYALMDAEAEILEKGEIPTPYDGLDVFVDTLVSIYEKYPDVEALAMSVPGKIDSKKGYMYTSGALKYCDNVHLSQVLEERIHIPVCLENDAKCAALAELWKGSLQEYENAAVIVLGTGIGGAIIIDGKLYRGKTFAAGEFSGIPVHWDQPYKAEGNVGWAFVNGVSALMKEYAKAKEVDPSEVNGRIFFAAANEGGELEISLLDAFCDTLVTGMYAMQLILDTEVYAIGGGISQQPLLMARLQHACDVHASKMSANSVTHPVRIVPCTFHNDSNMIGALYHYLYEIKGAE